MNAELEELLTEKFTMQEKKVITTNVSTILIYFTVYKKLMKMD